MYMKSIITILIRCAKQQQPIYIAGCLHNLLIRGVCTGDGSGNKNDASVDFNT